MYQKLKNSPPMTQDIIDIVIENDFCVKENPRLSDGEVFLSRFCDYMAQKLYIHPIIR